MRKQTSAIVLIILLFLGGCTPAEVRGPNPPGMTPKPPITPVRLSTKVIAEIAQAATPLASVQTPTVILTPAPSTTPAALLTKVVGQVLVRQVITGQNVGASFGTILQPGDVIVTGQTAQAEFLCSDGNRIQIESNDHLTVSCNGVPNPVFQELFLDRRGDQFELLPSARPVPSDDDQRPVVLSPRDTRLIERQPTIDWQEVEGAEAYEVIVRTRDSELWRAMTQETELSYPETAPVMQAGERYFIDVIADMGPDKPPRSLEPSFVAILSAKEVEQVHHFEAQVEALGLAVESARFLRAIYYANQELYDMAIHELTSLAEETPSALIHRLLGDIYLDVKLSAKASRHYQEAYQLAQAQDDPLAQVQAAVGLGHAAYADRKFAQALGHYQEALTLYQALGFEEQAGAVANFVADTERRMPTPTPEAE